jgi:predicted dehydrogenase
MIRDGALGKVVLAQIDYSRNYREDFWTQKIDTGVRPGVNLDWNAFLGPARKRPFDPDRFFAWRRYWDYSGGIASDLFIHRVTRIIKSCGLTFPDRGCASGGKFFWSSSPAEIPDTINILLDYPEGMTVQLVSSMANDAPIEHMIRGNKATLYFTRTGFTIKPQRLFQEGSREHTHVKTGAEVLDLQCDHRLGYYGVVAACLGNESYRRRQYLAWDRQRQRLRKA